MLIYENSGTDGIFIQARDTPACNPDNLFAYSSFSPPDKITETCKCGILD
jgi:hypothetical protein